MRTSAVGQQWARVNILKSERVKGVPETYESRDHVSETESEGDGIIF